MTNDLMTQRMNAKIIILVIVLLVVLAGLLWWFPIAPKSVPAPASTTSQAPEDTTAAINQELESVDLNDNLNTDFTDVDTDLQAL